MTKFNIAFESLQGLTEEQKRPVQELYSQYLIDRLSSYAKK